MIHFFRRIRKALFAESKFRKYFVYALGEIALVMIGILIALQVNNWNEQRKSKIVEVRLLQEMKINLDENIERLKSSIEDERMTVKSIEYVANSLIEQRPYNDSMDHHYGRADYAPDIVFVTTAFETFKSRGFEIINSDTLRLLIIDLFDAEYEFLLSQTVRLEDQFWSTASLPKLHEYFRVPKVDARSNGGTDFSVRPTNYEKLLKDDVYINMIMHRGTFRYTGMDLKESALDKTELLKDRIEDYLSQD